MYNDYFRARKVLVTGVAGVKGTWLAESLLRAGAEVIGLDRNVPGAASGFFAAGLRHRIEFVKGDVCDLPLMKSLVNRVAGVFHLAAMALVHECRRDPIEAYRCNTLGVISVLEAIRTAIHPVHAVFVTTDKVYKPKGGELWLESDPLGASGAYAVSKACAEHIIADYRHASGESRIGVGRAGNVVVGGDFYSSGRTPGGGRIFVDCFEALAAGRSPEIFNPSFTRPYTYGLDIVSGYMTLMSQLSDDGIGGEAFNFGPWEQYGVPNSMLATKICELWGGGIGWRRGTPRDEPFEFQSLSIRKSRELLGWGPAYTLYEALRDTARWYREWNAQGGEFAAEGSMAAMNAELLEAHEKAAAHLGVRWAAFDETSVAN